VRVSVGVQMVMLVGWSFFRGGFFRGMVMFGFGLT
jgi:hypothetical protein